MVKGVEKQPTNKRVIVAGPIDEANHGFYTIYPGEIAPPFPATRGKLEEMGYFGKDLEEQVKVNKSYKEF
ncbi:MAG: hypothetical protein KKF48_01060 [Nanoarchaeota archaeon]|nr:hypothetical protein [Nanoarchaeota archaeon]MBU1027612.1 hypothetical protein [Nanoarchaeota archaeon]